MRLSEADGRPVIGRDSAETLGTLQHVVVDARTRRITALHVAGRRRKALLVDWSAIAGFGPDGIIVHGEDPTRPPADDRELAVASGKLDLDGRLVLNENGDSLGVLGDVLFDEGSGELRAIIAGEGEIGADRLRAVGSYCVIVAAEGP